MTTRPVVKPKKLKKPKSIYTALDRYTLADDDGLGVGEGEVEESG